MAVRFQDYYQTLGVARNASAKEIQSAYRKLARKYHPDVSKEPGAEAKFKQAAEAYEVLKDPEKRKRYDALGESWREGQEFTPPAGWQPPAGGTHFEFRGSPGDFADLGGFSSFFESFFGGGSPFAGAGAGEEGEELFRQGARGARGTGARAPRRGTTHEAELTLALEDVLRGGTQELTLETHERGPDGQPRRARKSYSVKLPPGTTEGTTIRLAGQGESGAHGGPAGDLYLRVKLAPHPRFRVAGHDLVMSVPIAPWEAALGAKIPLALLDGEATVSVPAGSSSGSKLRLRGLGLPRRDGTRGDLLVELKIVVPKDLSAKERELFEELARVSSFRPRG